MSILLVKLALRRGLIPVALASALSAAPAAAECLDEVAALERRIDEMTRTKAKTAANKGAAPGATESWFGSPASLEGAREQLNNARIMGKDGDEAGCRSHLEQARRIVEGVPD